MLLSTEETVVPLGIPVPLIVSPAVTADVLSIVTVLAAVSLKNVAVMFVPLRVAF